jgi:hypothetical protein
MEVTKKTIEIAELLTKTADKLSKKQSFDDIELRRAKSAVRIKAYGKAYTVMPGELFVFAETEDDTLLILIGADRTTEITQRHFDALSDNSKKFKLKKEKQKLGAAFKALEED